MTAENIRLQYDSFRSFLEAYAPNVSQEGIFLATPEVRPIGSEVQFDIGLSDDFPILRGRGEVVRVEEPGDSAPGLALRFVETDAATATLVERIVERQLQDSAPVFELGGPEVVPEVVTEPDSVLEPEALSEAPLDESTDVEIPDPVETMLEEPSLEEPVEAPSRVTGEDLAATMAFETLDAPEVAEPIAEEAVEVAAPSESAIPEAVEIAPEAEEPLAATEEIPVLEVPEVEVEVESAPAADEPEPEAVRLPEGLEDQVLADADGVRQSKGKGPLWAALVLVAALAGAAYWQRDWISERLSGGGSTGAPGAEQAQLEELAEPMDESTEAPATEGAVSDEASAQVEDVAVEEVAPSPEPTGPATRIESVEWVEQSGSTLFTLTADGGLSQETISVQRLQDPPRVLVKIPGIGSPLEPATRAVGSEEVVGIRTGLHQVDGGSQLHLVVDLASPTAEVKRMQTDGVRLQLEVASTAIAP